MRRLLQLTAIASLLINSSQAGEYHIIGGSNVSCGTWTTARADGRREVEWHIYEAWMLGFLSGVGFAGAGHDPLRDVDRGAVTAWIDNYCHAHPLKKLN